MMPTANSVTSAPLLILTLVSCPGLRSKWLLGGLGTVIGPVAGAFVVVALENYLAQLGTWVTVVQGVIFVVCVLTFRRGKGRAPPAGPPRRLGPSVPHGRPCQHLLRCQSRNGPRGSGTEAGRPGPLGQIPRGRVIQPAPSER